MSAPERSSLALLGELGIAGIGAGGANIGAAIGGADAIDEGMGNGIEAGSGSGDDELRNGAPVPTPID